MKVLDFFKKNWKSSLTACVFFVGSLVATQIGNITTLFTNDVISDQQQKAQTAEFDLFAQNSSIVAHEFRDGKLFLKYKTCNPPSSGDYRYRAVINGEPFEELPKDGSWYNMNEWFSKDLCDEGWWGRRGYELSHTSPSSGRLNIRVVWKWRVRINDVDQPTYNTIMEYKIDEKPSVN